MLGNTFMQLKHKLQESHDLIRSTGLNSASFVVNGKTWHPVYMEPTAVQYENVVAYKLILSRVNHMFAVRDTLQGENTENLERYVVADKDWRDIKGFSKCFLFDFNNRNGWYHTHKKIFGHGATLDRAHWLYQYRLKWQTLRTLTQAA